MAFPAAIVEAAMNRGSVSSPRTNVLSRRHMALSSNDADLESLLPDVWIAAHPEHFLTYRRDQAEAAAIARRRRRERRRTEAPEYSRSP
jgi:predicted nucleic acid-binding protein